MNEAKINIITLLAAICSITLWLAFWRINTKKTTCYRQLCVLIITTAICCRIAFCLFTPTFYAPDEQSHFNYIKYLYEYHKLPVQTKIIERDKTKNNWEYYQPPLYYLIAVSVYAASGSLSNLISGTFDNEYFQVIAIRVFSIVLWIINVAFIFKILGNLQIKNTFFRTAVLCVVCLLPTYTFLSSVINNDNLLITLGGAILFTLTREISYRNSLLTGVLLGLAFLAKTNAVVYLFFAAIVLITHLYRKEFSFALACRHCVLIFFIPTLLFAPCGIRNINLYNSVFAVNMSNIPFDWPSLPTAVKYILETVITTFWATSGIHNNIKFMPKISELITYILLACFLFSLLSRQKSNALQFLQETKLFILASAGTFILNIVLVLQFALLYRQSQGRFLFPSLIPIAILIAIGVMVWVPPKKVNAFSVYVGGIFVTYAVSFTVYCLSAFKWLC
jgi:4-amino-4-deoxy-L-arabinose transferase-like glycosyltransferase